MVFRPADLDSKHHKRLSQAVERHHVKVARVKKTVTTQDPAKAKVEHSHKGVFMRVQWWQHIGVVYAEYSTRTWGAASAGLRCMVTPCRLSGRRERKSASGPPTSLRRSR